MGVGNKGFERHIPLITFEHHVKATAASKHCFEIIASLTVLIDNHRVL